jgi:hypothetical protein
MYTDMYNSSDMAIQRRREQTFLGDLRLVAEVFDSHIPENMNRRQGQR